MYEWVRWSHFTFFQQFPSSSTEWHPSLLVEQYHADDQTMIITLLLITWAMLCERGIAWNRCIIQDLWHIPQLEAEKQVKELTRIFVVDNIPFWTTKVRRTSLKVCTNVVLQCVGKNAEKVMMMRKWSTKFRLYRQQHHITAHTHAYILCIHLRSCCVAIIVAASQQSKSDSKERERDKGTRKAEKRALMRRRQPTSQQTLPSYHKNYLNISILSLPFLWWIHFQQRWYGETMQMMKLLVLWVEMPTKVWISLFHFQYQYTAGALIRCNGCFREWKWDRC